MGLLKHVACPFFALSHGCAALLALTSTPAEYAKSTGAPSEGPDESSPREKALLKFTGAFHIASSLLMVVGTWKETAHVRGLIVGFECVFNGACLLLGASSQMALQDLYSSMGLFTLAVGSAVVHSMEPGFFTKDKNA